MIMLMDITKTIRLDPGHYIIAVSGGVDSMTLLDVLVKRYPRKESDVHFTVAHFDHGIRDVSHIDRQLVQEEAVPGEGPVCKPTLRATLMLEACYVCCFMCSSPRGSGTASEATGLMHQTSLQGQCHLGC